MPSGSTAPTGLNAIVSPTQPAYDPGENIQITTSVFYDVCSNSTKNIVTTGYITNNSGYTSSTKTMFTGTISGQESQIFYTSNFTAPQSAGNYSLMMEIKGYTPAFYSFFDGSFATEFGPFYDFGVLKYQLMDHVAQYYPSQYSIISLIYDASNLIALQNVFIQNIPSINIVGTDQVLSFTREYEIVDGIKVMGVEVQVVPGYPNPTSYDGSTQIRWYPINAAYCYYGPNDTSCLTEDDEDEVYNATNDTWYNYSKVIDNMTVNTTFRVICTWMPNWPIIL